MLNKIFKSEKHKVILSFISVVLFVYIILFEFILPANGFLPKPTILIDSVYSLFKDYNFVKNYLFTFTAIYSVLIISYFLISVGSKYFIKYILAFPGLRELLDLGKYFIPFFLILLFELWFGDSIFGEYIFILFIIIGSLKVTLFNEIFSMKQDFVLSAKSLGMKEKDIYTKVVWKTVQPKLFDTIKKNHVEIWALVFIYEFVCKTEGIGNILYFVIKYNDLSVLLTLLLILIITFLVMELILNKIEKRFFFWD